VTSIPRSPLGRLLSRHAERAVNEALGDTRVVLINDARQCGKSTLVQLIGTAYAAEWRTLDRAVTRQAAEEDPTGFVTHLATTRLELVPVIDHAAHLAEDATRFEPADLALGGLVLIALQTEIKIDRNTTGQWQFRLHKKAMRDSTLGRIIGQLVALYTNTPQK
jgi:hypothetical protein